MLKLAQIIITAFSLIPSAIKVVRAVEDLLPEGGKGADKLALVRSIAEDAVATEADVKGDFEAAWPMLEKMIGKIVAFANRHGIFRKSESV